MSFNQFDNNFHGNGTFQNTHQFLPPPPPPPPIFIPPGNPWSPSTQATEFLKQLESKIPRIQRANPKHTLSISSVRDEICSLLQQLKQIKIKIKNLSDKMEELSNEEWSLNMKEIEEHKVTISKIRSHINNLNLEVLQKLVAKRLAKRARLKRLRSERKKEKEEWIKQMQEKSRQIDEKLQKYQDDITKAKQEKEAKIQADLVLKETLRKKQDAKKYIVKLDALVKLRRARQNTARGRGEKVSEVEGETFNRNIEKLKSLWNQRLAVYSQEENELRAKLAGQAAGAPLSAEESERRLMEALERWKGALFGGVMPQVDFAGDVAEFIAVRSEWDRFLSSDGSRLPVGWVPPSALSRYFTTDLCDKKD